MLRESEEKCREKERERERKSGEEERLLGERESRRPKVERREGRLTFKRENRRRRATKSWNQRLLKKSKLNSERGRGLPCAISPAVTTKNRARTRPTVSFLGSVLL